MQSPAEKIKERLTIVDVASAYIKLDRAGRNFKAKCPFHKERTPSFTVSPERGTYYCFGCGEKGDIFSFVEKLEGLDFKGALKLLAEKAGVALTEYRGEKGPSKEEKERLFELLERAQELLAEYLAKHEKGLAYLKGRGLTDESIRSWRLGYAPPEWGFLTQALQKEGWSDADLVASGLSIKAEGGRVYDRFRGRIMFPINDAAGRVVAFSGRYFEPMPPRPGGDGKKEEGEPAKYVNSPETMLFKKSLTLHGLDRAKAAIRRADFAILVEGQMDLLMSHQSGFPNTVALSGTALTIEHLKSVSYLSKRMVLALDSDDAGLRSTVRSAALAIPLGFEVKVAAIEGGKDPADLAQAGKDLYRDAIRASTHIVAFLLSVLRRRTKDERAYRKEVEEEVIPLVARMGSAMDRAHFAEEIARALSLPRDAVEEEVRKALTVSKTAPSVNPAPVQSQTPVDRFGIAVATLLAIKGDGASAVREKLLEMLGERLQTIVENSDLMERGVYTVEEHEGDMTVFARSLLLAIEADLLDVKIESARSQGDMKTLQDLVRRREALRSETH